jgi:hypothetical protein
MDNSSRVWRVGVWGWRVLMAYVLGGSALAGCGGKVDTLHRNGPPSGPSGGADGSADESAASGAGATATTRGGAASVPSDDDDDQEASTDDACPCPPHQSAPETEGSLVHFESLACYCSSAACPKTMNEAERDLCDRVETRGTGQVVRGVGCGLARVSLMDGTFSLDWIFEEGPGDLIGAALWGAAPGGLCSVHDYFYGELYPCVDEDRCHLCGEQRLALPRCFDTR